MENGWTRIEEKGGIFQLQRLLKLENRVCMHVLCILIIIDHDEMPSYLVTSSHRHLVAFCCHSTAMSRVRFLVEPRPSLVTAVPLTASLTRSLKALPSLPAWTTGNNGFEGQPC